MKWWMSVKERADILQEPLCWARMFHSPASLPSAAPLAGASGGALLSGCCAKRHNESSALLLLTS